MHRLPKLFKSAHMDPGSSPSRKPNKPKPRLDRRNAVKNIDYDFSPTSTSSSSSSSYYYSSSEESLRTRSLDLCGKTSFRIEGVEGEIDILCRSLGFSGIEDLGIPVDEYEAMKVRTRSAPVVFSAQKLDPSFPVVVVDHTNYNDGNIVQSCGNDGVDDRGIGGDKPAVGSSNCGLGDVIRPKFEESRDLGGCFGGSRLKFEESRDFGGYFGSSRPKFEESRDLGGYLGASRPNFEENLDFGVGGYLGSSRPDVFCSGLVDGGRVGDEVGLRDGGGLDRVEEGRGNGIKGVRPPVLAPPPSMSLPAIDKECSTWDMLRSFAPDSDTSVSRFELGEEDEEGGLKRVMSRAENRVLLESCSFTTSSNDDDSSSTTTEPMSSVSPNGRLKLVIVGWQKGELLGRGSFGSVYEGIADDGFFFAVKEVSLLDQGDEGKQRVSQLEQEIALLSQFEHENIVQYYGTKKDESHLYIFLELVTKGSLLSLYQKYTLRDSQVSAYTRQILHGLKYLHDRNVVHRDIKCANILVDTNGLVKLADFGLAKATKLNDVKSCKGTAFWMAPEVVRSRGYGLAADIWSLGCTVLEMLTGRFPYSHMECMAALFRIGRGERPPIPDSLSNDARDFIFKCLQADPNLRPTAAQLLDHPFVKRPLPSSSGAASPHFGRQI